MPICDANVVSEPRVTGSAEENKNGYHIFITNLKYFILLNTLFVCINYFNPVLFIFDYDSKLHIFIKLTLFAKISSLYIYNYKINDIIIITCPTAVSFLF